MNMNFNKVSIDRKKITSEEIEQHQDFDKILNNLSVKKTSSRFNLTKGLGLVGLSITVIIGIGYFVNTDNKTDVKLKNIPKALSQATQRNQVASIDQNNAINQPIEKKTITKTPLKTKPIVKQPTIELQQVNTSEIETNVQSAVPLKTKFENNNTYIPSINGVQEGNINYDDLVDAPYIQVDSEFRVVSFTVDLENNSLPVDVSGNRLPESVMHELSLIPKSMELTLTKIIIEDKLGNKRIAPSMRLHLIK